MKKLIFLLAVIIGWSCSKTDQEITEAAGKAQKSKRIPVLTSYRYSGPGVDRTFRFHYKGGMLSKIETLYGEITYHSIDPTARVSRYWNEYMEGKYFYDESSRMTLYREYVLGQKRLEQSFKYNSSGQRISSVYTYWYYPTHYIKGDIQYLYDKKEYAGNIYDFKEFQDGQIRQSGITRETIEWKTPMICTASNGDMGQDSYVSTTYFSPHIKSPAYYNPNLPVDALPENFRSRWEIRHNSFLMDGPLNDLFDHSRQFGNGMLVVRKEWRTPDQQTSTRLINIVVNADQLPVSYDQVTEGGGSGGKSSVIHWEFTYMDLADSF